MRKILIVALLATGLGTAEAKKKEPAKVTCTEASPICAGTSSADQPLLPVCESGKWVCRPNGAPILLR